MLAREQAVALVELVASEVLALRAVLAAVAGDAGRLATGKLAEVAVLKFVVVQVQVQVCFRSAVVECKSGCIELPTASLVAFVALVGLAVLEVQARLVVLAEAALAV